MKPRLKLSVLAASIAVVGGLAAPAAHAIPTPIDITGTLSISGAGPVGNRALPIISGTTGTWAGLAGSTTNWTGLDFGTVNRVISGDGSFSNFSFGDAVTFTDPTSFATPGTLFTTSAAGELVTFTWATVTKAYTSGTQTYSLLFEGTMTITGGATTYDPTAYNLGWSSATNYATFQADAAPMPVPASLALLGVGLLGVAGAARRSRQTAQA